MYCISGGALDGCESSLALCKVVHLCTGAIQVPCYMCENVRTVQLELEELSDGLTMAVFQQKTKLQATGAATIFVALGRRD